MRNRIWFTSIALIAFGINKATGSEPYFRVDDSTVYEENIKTVHGTVSDEMGPVAGATVFIKNTQKGTVTDIDGKFTLQVPVGATIVVSFIGYEDKEIVYKGESDLQVSLDENVTILDEVQVIAYGTTKKVTVTGAISSLNTEELLKTPAGNVSNALVGKVTGLASVQATGEPGKDAATLYVRGVGSLSENLSSPLVLVDGVERSFSDLDPNEIADVTILKDASATAVFGVRGANGVILVTTKRGEEGKTKISFSTSYSLQMPTRLPEFASSYDYATMYNNAQLQDGIAEDQLAFTPEMIEAFRTGSNPLLYPDTDWVDLLIKDKALQTQHNFTISGGSKSVRYFASLGVLTQDGLFNTYSKPLGYDSDHHYNRYNYRVNLDLDVTKTTSMKINLGGRLNSRSTPRVTASAQLFREIYAAPSFAGAGIVDGKYIQGDDEMFAGVSGGVADPLQNIYGKGYTVANGNTMNFDFTLQQKLDFLTKGLTAHVKASYNSGFTLTKTRSGSGDTYEAVLLPSGEVVLEKQAEKTLLDYSSSAGKSRDWYMEASLDYKRDFGKHHVSALAMYNQSMRYFPSGDYPGIPRSYVGFVGRATYDYNTRYLFDFSVGYNGSENFAPGKRFGVFPAGSVGWIISEEKFMSRLKPYVSYLKVRASYGIVGNDRTNDNTRFLYLPDVYDLSNGSYIFGSTIKNVVTASSESKVGNKDVTWETASKQNYGIDLYFFDDRLRTTFDYFIEHRKNILLTRQINPGYLAIELPTVNMGKVNNKGYEIGVKWNDRVNKFSYNIGFNLSYAKNERVFIDEIEPPYEYMRETGTPVGQNFGLKYDGFFTEEEAEHYEELKGKEIPDHGAAFTPRPGDVKYKDLNNDMKIDENDKTAIGYPVYPLFTGGLTLGFSYKGFDFSMTWQGAAKTSRMLSGNFRQPFGNKNNQSLMQYMIDDAWTPEKGDDAKAPAFSFSGASNNYQNSDLWLRDASYVRLKNVEIGYTLPKAWTDKLKIDQMRLFASGYNLLTFDKLKVCDPEATSTDTPAYPVVAIVNLGLKLSF